MSPFRLTLVSALLAAPVLTTAIHRTQDTPAYQERDFLTRVRRLTVEGRRAGEGYWSPDGKRLVFQSEREPGNPFYQIYTLDLTTGETRAHLAGHRQDDLRVLPARHRRDLNSRPRTRSEIRSSTSSEELAFRASGKERRYSWDYDPEMDIYATTEKTGALKRLTDGAGYDAEGSYSPDGQWIVFSSMREAYNRPLTDAEKKQLDENPSYFAEIYIMRADGSGQKRLTNVPGYDGGPFFTPDGKRIVWRRFDEHGTDRRRLDDEAGRHRPEADHRLRRDELGALHASVRRVLHLRVEQARLRELRAVHRRRRRHEGAGARHLLGRLRRPAGAVARRQAARVDVEPRRRARRADVPRAVES